MDKNYWLSRWESKNIGFHQVEGNNYLHEYFRLLDLYSGDHIFVPLCGKTTDMLWLSSQGLHVTGVELSVTACEEFFTENNLAYTKKQQGEYSIYQSDNITLFCGDFFALPNVWLDKINAIYDRAALIALPADYRLPYAEKIIDITMSGTKMLLISLETTKETTSPPFAVMEKNIHDLYERYFAITKLAKAPENTPHLIEKGYTNLHNVVYILERK